MEIVLKLLDWPFLLFVFLFLFVLLFRRQLEGVLGRGDITISWGEGRSIRLRELSESLDEELDPIRDEVEALKKAVDSLQSKVQMPQSERLEPKLEKTADQEKEVALRRMKEALTSGKWRWRSIDRLAVIGGVSESEAMDILRNDPDVIFSIGKSGRTIARLKSR
jgi:predicted nuclease with TOPRIM domain